MAVLLALTAAASWGTSDFLGGLAGRRTEDDITLSIAFLSQLLGLVGLTAIALLVGGDPLSRRDVLLSVVAGLGGALGVGLLYRGLRIGRMGVVAPVTGAGAAILPVIVGVVMGEVPGTLAWAGVVAALVAIVLVSREPGSTLVARAGFGPDGLLEAIGAGIGFGVIFVLLDQVSAGSGLLPLIPMKLAACGLLLAVGLIGRQRLLPPRVALWPVLGVGVLDNLANVAYLLATRQGLLAIVAVVSSLYPVGTVLLARGVLHEHLHPSQLGGLALAGLGVGLIAIG